MKFTVLQSVYKKDNPRYLHECFYSIANQTLPANKIVLVKDGVLTPDLEKVINDWQGKLPLQVVGYGENKGLAYALNYGLQYVDTELVARMDSDDICYPDRFEKQVEFMERYPEISVSSGHVEEFIEESDKVVAIKKVPIGKGKIERYLQSRNAMNHMAVIFKKSAVESVGGYEQVPYFEDYDLWVRMVQAGYKLENEDVILVKARIGNDMIGRRHGIQYCRHEIYFLRKMYKSGFINKIQFYKSLVLRLPVRLLPKRALELIYKNFLRGHK